jgi:outer membrane protein assembly factor BamB
VLQISQQRAHGRASRDLAARVTAKRFLALLAAVTAGTLALAGSGSALCGGALHPALAGTTPLRTWIPNGEVSAIARVGKTIYLGGSFTRISVPTGSGVVVRRSKGEREPGWPEVTGGPVRAVAPDGSGGWYIGGGFDHVGGVPLNGLAHIQADRSVDPRWRLAGTYDVDALAVSGARLYVGFATGEPKPFGEGYTGNVLAFGRKTGELLPWRASLPGGRVYTLAVSGRTVYVGGSFDGVLAAIDAKSARRRALKASFRIDPCFDDPNRCGNTPAVFDLAVAGGRLFVAGFFDHVGRKARPGLAALDVRSGATTPWIPAPTLSGFGWPYVLVAAGSSLYLGGVEDFAALDTSTGKVRWRPRRFGGVSALAVQGGVLYVGGEPAAGGLVGKVAAYNRRTGKRLAWNAKPNGSVLALGATRSNVYVGGSFGGFGGVERRGLAALDATTGEPTAWNPALPRPKPAFSGPVNALAAQGETLYVGGEFDRVGSKTRHNLAAFDLTSGALTGWNPDFGGEVDALAVSANTVYAGGDFHGGEPPVGLAAIDAVTGVVRRWDAITKCCGVLSLALSGSTLFLGGLFDALNGQVQDDGIAAVDATTGALLPWNPGANSPVWALLASGRTLYAGGVFTAIGGTTRRGLAALDTVSGAVSAWNPDVTGGAVAALALSGSTLYAGGDFDHVSGLSRAGLAAIDTATGAVSAWDPRLSGGASGFLVVHAVAVSDGTLYVGGSFSGAAGTAQSNFAVFSEP